MSGPQHDGDYEACDVECPYCLAGPGDPCIDMRSGWRSNDVGVGNATVSTGVGGISLRKMHPERRSALKRSHD